MTRRTINSDDLTILSPYQQILRNIWDKAGREGGLTLPPMGKDAAYRTRFLLFSMAKAMREQNLPRDRELNIRIRDLTVRLDKQPDGKLCIRVCGKVPDELQNLAEMFGVDVSAETDDRAEESLRKIQQRLTEQSTDSDETSVNPFYTRG